ncbi:MAG: hypothetical protein KDD43_02925 [Bdellovibrionales bacterium]|nr:hypothetical protein [Bdellovibrionales bacterium]
MAPVCPVCQSQITDDFGLINCPSCGASLFIEMDGQVRAYETANIDSDQPPAGIPGVGPADLGEANIPEGAEDGGLELQWDDRGLQESFEDGEEDGVRSESRAALASMENWDSVPELGDVESEGPSEYDEAVGFDEVPLDASDEALEGDDTAMLEGEDQVATVGLTEIPEGDDSPPPLDDGGVSEFDELSDISDEIGMVGTAGTEYVPQGGGSGLEDMSNLSDFGNSQESVGQSGPLRVRVRLGGIDSPELREDLRHALTDKKFLWDIEELMRSIEGGILVIDNATPLKAAILIERIKSLPLDISWEQFATTQP